VSDLIKTSFFPTIYHHSNISSSLQSNRAAICSA